MPDFHLMMDFVKPGEALLSDPRWLLKIMSQLCRIFMTDGCQMVALERAETGTILTCFCLKWPLDPQEKADTWYARGSVPRDARLNTEPQEHLMLTCISGTKLCPRITRAGCLHSQSRKVWRRGKPVCYHPDGNWVFAAQKPWQNPLQESQWELLWGQVYLSGTESHLGGQRMLRWCGKGTASLGRVGSHHTRGAQPNYVLRLAWGGSFSHHSSGFFIALLYIEEMSFTTHSQSRKILGKHQLIGIINIFNNCCLISHMTPSLLSFHPPKLLKIYMEKKLQEIKKKKIFDFSSDKGWGGGIAS